MTPSQNSAGHVLGTILGATLLVVACQAETAPASQAVDAGAALEPEGEAAADGGAGNGAARTSDAGAKSAAPADAGTSGLPKDGRIEDLPPTSRKDLCEWMTVALGGVGLEKHCADCDPDGCTDYTVAVNTVAKCLQVMNRLPECIPNLTVGEFETCMTDQSVDLCLKPPSCLLINACGV